MSTRTELEANIRRQYRNIENAKRQGQKTGLMYQQIHRWRRMIDALEMEVS